MTADLSFARGPTPRLIRVLLTVPHLNALSPYREMMALAELLPRDRIHLTVCSLRRNGLTQTGPKLASMGIPFTVAAFRPRGRTMRALLDSFRAQIALARMGPFDLQHSLDFTSSPFEALMARYHGRPFVFTQRDLNQDGHTLLLRLKCRLATAIISISDATCRVLLKHGAHSGSITQIANGLCLEEFPFLFRETSVAAGPIILSVGQIVRLKRHEDAIRAFAAFASLMPHARLRIVGPVYDRAYFQELLALSSGLGLAERIEFMGERSDVVDLMCSADVLLFCSESEAMGWVIVEAMAVGLPVVASKAEGPTEIIGDSETGLLVQIGDVSGYTRAIRFLLENRHQAKEMAAKARLMVEQRFDARLMVNATAALYQRVHDRL